MKISDYNIRAVVEDSKVPYYCKKCKSQHRVGTKVWKEHLEFIDTSKISKTIRNKAVVRAKQLEREGKKHTIKFEKKIRSEILGSYNKLLRKLKPARYYVWEASQYGLGTYGSSEGYKTVEELMKDQKWLIGEAKKGERIIVILKATPYRIIKAKKVG